MNDDPDQEPETPQRPPMAGTFSADPIDPIRPVADQLISALEDAPRQMAMLEAVESFAIGPNWFTAADAIAESLREVNEAFTESFRELKVTFDELAKSLSSLKPKVSELLALFPDNIGEGLAGSDFRISTLRQIGTVAFNEGLPLSWVPRAEIVRQLLDADGPEARIAILVARRDDILADCETVTAPIKHEWAVQCGAAICALRARFEGPAQSHAANIIDSILLECLGKKGPQAAKDRAQVDVGTLAFRELPGVLALQPLARAYVKWHPGDEGDPPNHFARHMTVHRVGDPGVFTPTSALLAVMLATSLTAQYSRVALAESRPGESPPRLRAEPE